LTCHSSLPEAAPEIRELPPADQARLRQRQREGVGLAKQRGAYTGRKKTPTPERAAELVQRAADGIPKSVLASDYGINRETVYQYLCQAKLP
jgi:DNA invertase Pin-like site-specific DNA recombinase